MTVTTNEFGQNNLFAKEPPMVVEDYNRKGLFSPMQQREMYNGRWAMMGVGIHHWQGSSLVSSDT